MVTLTYDPGEGRRIRAGTPGTVDCTQARATFSCATQITLERPANLFTRCATFSYDANGHFNVLIVPDPASRLTFTYAPGLQVVRRPPAGLAASPQWIHITAREAQVLRLLPFCGTCKEVARCLGTSTRTVHHQVESLLRKFDVDCTSQLIELTRRLGLIEPF